MSVHSVAWLHRGSAYRKRPEKAFKAVYNFRQSKLDPTDDGPSQTYRFLCSRHGHVPRLILQSYYLPSEASIMYIASH